MKNDTLFEAVKDTLRCLSREQKIVEESGDKEAYQKFFKSALKDFGVKSPSELDPEKKKEFFDFIDKNWESPNETD